MRTLLSICFAVLAVLALFVAISSLSYVPGAWEQHGREPEDFYGAAIGFLLSGVIGAAWLRAAFRVFERNARSGSPFGRFLFGFTLVLGMLILGSIVLAPLEGPRLAIGTALVVLPTALYFTLAWRRGSSV